MYYTVHNMKVIVHVRGLSKKKPNFLFETFIGKLTTY
jgi:hypothetical protein